jgi:PKHD-type hydroxylase
MLLTIPGILNADELGRVHDMLAEACWIDGRDSAGHQSVVVKHNRQLAEDSPAAKTLGKLVLQALSRHQAFTRAALPARVFPPMFNRYEAGMGYGNHIDNAIRNHPGGIGRTDVSVTLFLSDPASYDGGELVVAAAAGEQRIKLPAGDLVLYPTGSVHRVEPVTRGVRMASFFWVQSLVRDDAKRALLYDLDLALGGLRQRGLAAAPEMVMLTGTYHNLVRQWAET